MFGYIRPHVPELRVREHDYYRGVYCGLCRAMGSCTGCLSRMTLSYDFVCLALLRMTAAGELPTFTPRRCAAHPLTRRSVADPSASLDYCARAAALLGWHKLQDDLADEGGMRRLRARLALPAASAARRRALREGGEEVAALDADIADALTELRALEAESAPSVDAPADTFGRLMCSLAARGLPGDAARIAGEFGRHLGRWIYVIDAIDDYPDDVKLGRYNPFAASGGLDEGRRASLTHALTAELMAVEAALDLLDLEAFPNAEGLLRNLLYLGMPRAAARVLGGEPTEDSAPTISSDRPV